MKTLTVDFVQLGDDVRLTLAGYFNESAILPKLDSSTLNQIEISFNNVAYINSTGIAIWIRWLEEIEKSAKKDFKIKMSECPRAVVDQIIGVIGFLTSHCTVESFFVPYYCEASDEAREVLFALGREFVPGNPPQLCLPHVVDSKGNVMEPDADQAKYFSFLNRP